MTSILTELTLQLSSLAPMSMPMQPVPSRLCGTHMQVIAADHNTCASVAARILGTPTGHHAALLRAAPLQLQPPRCLLSACRLALKQEIGGSYAMRSTAGAPWCSWVQACYTEVPAPRSTLVHTCSCTGHSPVRTHALHHRPAQQQVPVWRRTTHPSHVCCTTRTPGKSIASFTWRALHAQAYSNVPRVLHDSQCWQCRSG